ncbi:antitoxin of toxin-antitoxin stability system [Sphingobium estronivorans]|uniref:antitoxin of toxin-antitoxin stability system n=1 Tax=Sphingobium estronivorans TaxID=1577690 RepID=UPI00123C3413|nr:antitoxin of toxin-antitoxin stability system [Sphingobium estronivorans]
MPELMEIETYRLDELSESAKVNARCWYRETCLDDYWHDVTFDDFEQICDILGVALRTDIVRLHGGGSRSKPRIYFSGFWSQGDGACYEGVYSYTKDAHRRIRDHAPIDTELHRIADALRAAQSRNFYQLSADIHHRGRYYHEHSMAISVERDGTTQDMTADAEETITQALRDLACWLYARLGAEYDFLSSDEAVDQGIGANGYRFTSAGERFARLA